MVRAIVDQVAALAKATQISWAVIAGIVIEVGRREHNAGSPDPCCFLNIRPSGRLTSIAAPNVPLDIEPATIRQTTHRLPMWPTAILANATPPLEPHPPADLRPVNWVRPTHFSSDRHRRPLRYFFGAC